MGHVCPTWCHTATASGVSGALGRSIWPPFALPLWCLWWYISLMVLGLPMTSQPTVLILKTAPDVCCHKICTLQSHPEQMSLFCQTLLFWSSTTHEHQPGHTGGAPTNCDLFYWRLFPCSVNVFWLLFGSVVPQWLPHVTILSTSRFQCLHSTPLFPIRCLHTVCHTPLSHLAVFPLHTCHNISSSDIKDDSHQIMVTLYKGW